MECCLKISSYEDETVEYAVVPRQMIYLLKTNISMVYDPYVYETVGPRDSPPVFLRST